MSIDNDFDFGSKLKAAREEKNISLAHVSETLKLSIEKIENIEASDISLLPPPAFTCGYLRLFSKMVDLNEDEIIGLYNQSVNSKSDDSMLNSTSDLPSQATSNDVGMRVVNYSLVLVAIVLFVVWLQKFDDKQAGSDMKESSVTKQIVNTVEPEFVESGVGNIVLPVQKDIELTDQAKLKQDEDIVVPFVEKEIELVESEVMTEDDKADKIIALAKEASPIASVGLDEVVITAKDNCWVEVSDANKQLLYFSLLKKDEVAELKGQEPFSVFLGKATAISITLNDIKYDISKHVRSNQIARFTMSMDSMLENQVKKDVINNNNKKSVPLEVNEL